MANKYASKSKWNQLRAKRFYHSPNQKKNFCVIHLLEDKNQSQVFGSVNDKNFLLATDVT